MAQRHSASTARVLTLEMGARQLVVHDALDTMLDDGSYVSWLTPMTNMGVSSFAGAEMMTFFAPPLMCAIACACVHTYCLRSRMEVD